MGVTVVACCNVYVYCARNGVPAFWGSVCMSLIKPSLHEIRLLLSFILPGNQWLVVEESLARHHNRMHGGRAPYGIRTLPISLVCGLKAPQTLV